MAAQAAVRYVSCGGTSTEWEARGNPDDFPEHAALHAKITDLYRQLNAMKDLMDDSTSFVEESRDDFVNAHCYNCGSNTLIKAPWIKRTTRVTKLGWWLRRRLTRYLRTR